MMSKSFRLVEVMNRTHWRTIMSWMPMSISSYRLRRRRKYARCGCVRTKVFNSPHM